MKYKEGYTPATRWAARDAVLLGRLSCSAAAGQFGVPYTTIYDDVQHVRTGKIAKEDLRFLLTSDEEALLVGWCRMASRLGFHPSKRVVRRKAKQLLQLRGKVHKGTMQRWWLGFRHRHKAEFNFRRRKKRSRTQALAALPEYIEEFYALLEQECRTHNISPEMVWNVDEVRVRPVGVSLRTEFCCSCCIGSLRDLTSAHHAHFLFPVCACRPATRASAERSLLCMPRGPTEAPSSRRCGST